MREPTAVNRTLTTEDVRTEATGLLREHLPLSADGYKVTTKWLLDVLLHAAAMVAPVKVVCDSLLYAADANTVRSFLNEPLRSDDPPVAASSSASSPPWPPCLPSSAMPSTSS